MLKRLKAFFGVAEGEERVELMRKIQDQAILCESLYIQQRTQEVLLEILEEDENIWGINYAQLEGEALREYWVLHDQYWYACSDHGDLVCALKSMGA